MNPVPLGQHFLTNKNIAIKMVNLLLPMESPVLEIGPGRGILTRQLVEKRGKQPLILVELDRHLARDLVKKFPDRCIVIQDSILNIRLSRLDLNNEIICLGNIPYYLSKDLIDWTIGESDLIENGLYMMQKEFVDKLIPGEKTQKNPQSLMFRYVYESQKEFDVKPGSFSPPPAVRSSVFRFRKKKALPPSTRREAFYRFLKLCFINRRKTMINTLSAKGMDKEKLLAVFGRQNIPADIRAEQLDLAQFSGIYEEMGNQKSPVI